MAAFLAAWVYIGADFNIRDAQGLAAAPQKNDNLANSFAPHHGTTVSKILFEPAARGLPDRRAAADPGAALERMVDRTPLGAKPEGRVQRCASHAGQPRAGELRQHHGAVRAPVRDFQRPGVPGWLQEHALAIPRD